jgi:hypothetical protein
MTALIVGRPKRKRATDRVNYNLDSDLRSLLREIADRNGRNEGAQIEQLILFYEAADQLNQEGVPLTLGAINARKNQLWAAIIASDTE